MTIIHNIPERAQFNAPLDGNQLLAQMRGWATELGFSQIAVADVDLSSAEEGLRQWLLHGFHGSMSYMAAHGMRRARPAELVPGTVRVLTARMDYLPRSTKADWAQQEMARSQQPLDATVSLYARGRDYHKVLRSRLQRLAERIAQHITPLGYRVFTDSAPVLEVELAARSGLGWRGKHTLLLDRDAGSMFFLGEIFVDIALPLSLPDVVEQVTPSDAGSAVSSARAGHCGSCTACISACPTQAIVAPYRLDARRCISYLTIESADSIPLELRPLIGNRIYGCDDCQLVCPWNKFAKRSTLPDFDARHALEHASLVPLFAWTEQEFLQHTEGNPIRRIGHIRWLRNIAVALGNALRSPLSEDQRGQLRQALLARSDHSSELVREHVQWALMQKQQE